MYNYLQWGFPPNTIKIIVLVMFTIRELMTELDITLPVGIWDMMFEVDPSFRTPFSSFPFVATLLFYNILQIMDTYICPTNIDHL